MKLPNVQQLTFLRLILDGPNHTAVAPDSTLGPEELEHKEICVVWLHDQGWIVLERGTGPEGEDRVTLTAKAIENSGTIRELLAKPAYKGAHA